MRSLLDIVRQDEEALLGCLAWNFKPHISIQLIGVRSSFPEHSHSHIKAKLSTPKVKQLLEEVDRKWSR